MEQIKDLYERSKVDNTTIIKGFVLNKNLATALNILCRVKGLTNSHYINLIIRKEIEDYLNGKR